jgi:hypothetical protein
MSWRLLAGVIRRMPKHPAEGAIKPLFRPTRATRAGGLTLGGSSTQHADSTRTIRSRGTPRSSNARLTVSARRAASLRLKAGAPTRSVCPLRLMDLASSSRGRMASSVRRASAVSFDEANEKCTARVMRSSLGCCAGADLALGASVSRIGGATGASTLRVGAGQSTHSL